MRMCDVVQWRGAARCDTAIPPDVLGKLQGWVSGWPHHGLAHSRTISATPPFRAFVLPRCEDAA